MTAPSSSLPDITEKVEDAESVLTGVRSILDGTGQGLSVEDCAALSKMLGYGVDWLVQARAGLDAIQGRRS